MRLGLVARSSQAWVSQTWWWLHLRRCPIRRRGCGGCSRGLSLARFLSQVCFCRSHLACVLGGSPRGDGERPDCGWARARSGRAGKQFTQLWSTAPVELHPRARQAAGGRSWYGREGCVGCREPLHDVAVLLRLQAACAVNRRPAGLEPGCSSLRKPKLNRGQATHFPSTGAASAGACSGASLRCSSRGVRQSPFKAWGAARRRQRSRRVFRVKEALLQAGLGSQQPRAGEFEGRGVGGGDRQPHHRARTGRPWHTSHAQPARTRQPGVAVSGVSPSRSGRGAVRWGEGGSTMRRKAGRLLMRLGWNGA
jgi:hypothetical protein